MMRKIFINLFSLLLVFGATTMNAQDASQANKNAKKAWSKYATETDKTKKMALLEEAKTAIETATTGIDAFEGKNLTKVWLLAGKIYNETTNNDVKASLLDPTHQVTNKAAGLNALNAYTKAIETATKGYFKKEAVEALSTQTSANLGNLGLIAFNAGDYAEAFTNYNAVLTLRDLLKANGNESVLADEADLNQHMYLTAMSAMASDQAEASRPIFEKLYAANYKQAGVYDALWKLNKEADEVAALKYLEKGRELFPEDEGLRISEINYYMTNNKFEILEGKLKGAIKADPKNVSLYNALGNTYDNLYQQEQKAGNAEAAEKHFNNALSYYNQGLEVDGSDFFALYNVGVLYVNKANSYVTGMKTLEDKGDYSKAGLRAIEDLKAKADKEFETSLQFFQKAEKANPNEINTLSALKEIYARQNDFDTSNEFKKRMQVVEDGGTNTSYFEGK